MMPPEPDFPGLSARLVRLRRRNRLLNMASVFLACVAVLALLVARTALADGGVYARLRLPSMIVAGVAVALMLLTYALREDAS